MPINKIKSASVDSNLSLQGTLDVNGSIDIAGKEVIRRSGNDIIMGDVDAAGGAGGVTIRTNGGDKLKIDTSGHVITPSSCSFMVRGNTSQWRKNTTTGWFTITGGVGHAEPNGGTTGTIGHNLTTSGMQAYQSGNSFNTSTGVFTAPVSGRYEFTIHLYGSKQVTNNSYMHVNSRINGVIISDYTIWHRAHNVASNVQTDCTKQLSLSANDTFAFAIYNSAGNTFNYYADYTRISGKLIS